MHDLKRLKEKAKLQEEVNKLEAEVKNVKKEISDIRDKIKNNCFEALKGKILEEFEEFCKEKNLSYRIQDTQVEALSGMIRLSFLKESIREGSLCSINLTIDNKSYEIGTFLKLAEFRPPSEVKTAFVSSDDREMIELRGKKNSLEDELQLQKATLNSLKKLSNLTCDKLPIEFKIFNAQFAPNSFRSFKELLETLIR